MMMKFFKACILAATIALSKGQLPPECENIGNYVKIILVRNALANQASAVEQAFKDAEAKWSKVIQSELPTITLRNNVDLSGRCGVQGAELAANTVVENLIIFAEVRNIDGPGSVLGQAGPCVFNSVNGNVFPRAGSMTFDSSDVANLLNQGTFESVVLHEVGHIIGIGGRQWQQNLRGNRQDPIYVGAEGVKGFQEIGGSPNVQGPDVENVGGGGTALSHWRTSTFGNELMTGFLSGNQQPMSAMTVRSLIDLGYDVDLNEAEAFNVNGRLLEEHDHDHVHGRQLEGEWEQVQWPDISKSATFLGPDGTWEQNTAAFQSAASGEDSAGNESGGSGAVVGAALGGAFAALAAVGGVFMIKRNRNASSTGTQVQAHNEYAGKSVVQAPTSNFGSYNPNYPRGMNI